MTARRHALPVLALLMAAAPLAGRDPWAKAPAQPTACYAKEDAFCGELERAKAELEEASHQRDQTNPSLKQIQRRFARGYDDYLVTQAMAMKREMACRIGA